MTRSLGALLLRDVRGGRPHKTAEPRGLSMLEQGTGKATHVRSAGCRNLERDPDGEADVIVFRTPLETRLSQIQCLEFGAEELLHDRLALSDLRSGHRREPTPLRRMVQRAEEASSAGVWADPSAAGW